MYGLTEPEAGGSGNVQPIRNDTELRKKLLSAGIDEPTIQQIVDRLQRKDDFAILERGAGGKWTVTFGNKKTG
jgi:Fe2+ transport system protein FeoA